jgi:hypothetical protein
MAVDGKITYVIVTGDCVFKCFFLPASRWLITNNGTVFFLFFHKRGFTLKNKKRVFVLVGIYITEYQREFNFSLFLKLLLSVYKEINYTEYP